MVKILLSSDWERTAIVRSGRDAMMQLRMRGADARQKKSQGIGKEVPVAFAGELPYAFFMEQRCIRHISNEWQQAT